MEGSPALLDSRPVSGYGVTFFRGNDNGSRLGRGLCNFASDGQIGGFQGVSEEHGDGHRADASGDGSDGRDFFGYGIEVYVANEAIAALSFGSVDAVDADVDDDGALADHIARDVERLSDGGDEDVRLSRYGRHVGGA